MNLKLTLLLLLCAMPLPAVGAEYFVAGNGRDSATGTSVTEPFRTIGRAAQLLQPGDTCWIREGVYRETVRLTESGQADKPITFARYRDERVILDGADVVTGPWSQDKNGVWRAGVAAKEPIEAVFCDGQMMVEARWPNCSWEQNWEEDRKWALTGKGSQLGVIECPALASAGQDLSGGLLYLRLSKGNNCFTRSVTSHRAGAASLEYDKTGIEGRAWNEDSMPERIRKYGFESNRFFIAARGALDVAGEWWHDAERSHLLFLPPGGDPSKHEVSIKRRVTGFEGAGLSDVVLEGLEFRGCNVRFENCRRVVVRSCRFRYPSTPRIFPDGKSAIELQRNLRVTGEDNVLERLLVEWAVDGALEVEGSGNRIEDCIVHDTNLHGRHPGPGISLRGRGVRARDAAGSANIIRRCTVYNVGGVGIHALGNGPATAEFNHVFNAGLHCVDISSLYIPVGKDMAGTTVHHNWFHDLNGIGFRVDIEGRGITFHHNLVWDASVGCKLQGFQLAAYNNTVLAGDSKSGFIVVFEPEATPEERAGWRVRNNAAFAFNDRLSLRNDPRKSQRRFLLPLATEDGAIDHNRVVSAADQARWFVDSASYDFRPKPDGPLDAAGVAIEGIAKDSTGGPPAIGALETGGTAWLAGASWMNDSLPVPVSPAEASALARNLRPAAVQLGKQDRRYDDQ